MKQEVEVGGIYQIGPFQETSDGTCGLMVVIAADGRGICIGLLFVSVSLSELIDSNKLPRHQRLRFGDLGIINGTWPKVGRYSELDKVVSDRSLVFKRENMFGQKFIERYGANLRLVADDVEIQPATDEDSLPSGELFGAKAVEELVEVLLAKSSV